MGLPEQKKREGEAGKAAQLSNRAILKMWRARAPKMFREIDKILDGPNENAKAGIIKMGMGKLVADLKATELTGKDGETLTFVIKRGND